MSLYVLWIVLLPPRPNSIQQSHCPRGLCPTMNLLKNVHTYTWLSLCPVCARPHASRRAVIKCRGQGVRILSWPRV
ncbi:hypothetical protein EV401DRAFT_1967819 [Pisolithus croceorrhizus]|nr:hypothetical protein EV401DRAFT_1967819 [Pisolithus croceorrhizus]